jgi:hypothetical protein
MAHQIGVLGGGGTEETAGWVGQGDAHRTLVLQTRTSLQCGSDVHNHDRVAT